MDIGQVLFCVFMDRDGVEANKHAKKELGQYPAILTEQTWSIKDLLQYNTLQYNNFYFNTMVIKALPLMGSCI